MPKKKDPPARVVDPLAPSRPNPSKFVAKALSGADVGRKKKKKKKKRS